MWPTIKLKQVLAIVEIRIEAGQQSVTNPACGAAANAGIADLQPEK